MKNTVIKITTKKDYDAVMRKLEETGYKLGYGVSWVNNLPSINKITKDNFSLSLHGGEDEQKWVSSGGFGWYKRCFPKSHFTTAKAFLIENETSEEKSDRKWKDGTFDDESPDNTALIKLLESVANVIEMDYPNSVYFPQLREFALKLEKQESTTTTINDDRGNTTTSGTFSAVPMDYKGAFAVSPNNTTLPPKPKKIKNFKDEPMRDWSNNPEDDYYYLNDWMVTLLNKVEKHTDAINEMRGSK